MSLQQLIHYQDYKKPLMGVVVMILYKGNAVGNYFDGKAGADTMIGGR
ncbi:hypothetical protein INT80_11390 [Gallibacterium anatis]|uniref:Uncharacterized protein n=1 Tax=Gallibacterium anatis TaxID=750 RepID=A0A930Y5C9_9PAST|nr:hypothetical protein [Gallibacterium anatis]